MLRDGVFAPIWTSRPAAPTDSDWGTPCSGRTASTRRRSAVAHPPRRRHLPTRGINGLPTSPAVPPLDFLSVQTCLLTRSSALSQKLLYT